MTEEKNTIVLKTTKFGEIEINKDSIFSFVSPIIGFNDLKEYTIIDYKPDSPFKWLQSVEDMDLAFPITLCSFFGIDYQFDIPDEEAQRLEIECADDVFVCNIANIPQSNPQGATINMVAPIVANISNKKAMQLILKNTEFEVRHRLFDDERDGE
ncbi:MAG: flagellar assembly protein FliW [Candidatus Gastranaerophilales bacterium]|nr:flagellar assembly protein FliW [Candidatus Gastranaerophilales bacterium]